MTDGGPKWTTVVMIGRLHSSTFIFYLFIYLLVFYGFFCFFCFLTALNFWFSYDHK